MRHATAVVMCHAVLKFYYVGSNGKFLNPNFPCFGEFHDILIASIKLNIKTIPQYSCEVHYVHVLVWYVQGCHGYDILHPYSLIFH
jgi:hypothetical protein